MKVRQRKPRANPLRYNLASCSVYCAFRRDRALRSRLLAKALSISQLAFLLAVPSSLASSHHYLASFSSPFLLRPRKFIHRAVVPDGGTIFGVFPSDPVNGRRAVLCAARNHRHEDDDDHHHHRSHRNSSTGPDASPRRASVASLNDPSCPRLIAHFSWRLAPGRLAPLLAAAEDVFAWANGGGCPGPRLSSGGIAAWTMLGALGAGTPR